MYREDSELLKMINGMMHESTQKENVGHKSIMSVGGFLIQSIGRKQICVLVNSNWLGYIQMLQMIKYWHYFLSFLLFLVITLDAETFFGEYIQMLQMINC